jgi:hypothetical protein
LEDIEVVVAANSDSKGSSDGVEKLARIAPKIEFRSPALCPASVQPFALLEPSA